MTGILVEVDQGFYFSRFDYLLLCGVDLTKDPDPTYETIRIFGRVKTKASD